MPEPKFIVLTSQRSGSSWFMDVLNNLEGVRTYGELFLPPSRKKGESGVPLMSPQATQYIDETAYAHPRFRHWREDRKGMRPFSPFTYLNELYRRPGGVGFKLMYSQVCLYPEVWFYLATRRLPVIHLIRQNFLDIVISTKRVGMTRTAHRIVGEGDDSDLVQIHLEPEELIDRMRRWKRKVVLARRLLRWFRMPHVEVIYEDLSRDPENFARVWAFLGFDPDQQSVDTKYVKLVRASHVDLIENYVEVKNALADTEFAELIN
jgi:LPS sulfotransferase NodH